MRALFEHIATDPRHDEVAVLDARTVGGRVFSRWAMAEVAEQGHSDIALIAHADGVAPAAARRASGEQELVLDLMRHAARAAPAQRQSLESAGRLWRARVDRRWDDDLEHRHAGEVRR